MALAARLGEQESMGDGMCVAFRVDASLAIGSGHVMRCLTLAAALRDQGADCHFLCREPQGHLNRQIAERGFAVHRLPTKEGGSIPSPAGQGHSPAADGDHEKSPHAHWLQTTQATDAHQTLETLRELAPDWLIVDHYALDAQWESVVREAIPGMRVMVIDDLADRPHQAELLLDQNLGRKAEDYHGLVSGHCRLLVGPKYALLRPEFAEWREWSLERRQEDGGSVKRLLVTLGGVDRDNVTGQVLDALSKVDLPAGLEITVVMGASAPWLETVRDRARQMPRSTEVVVNVDDMARRMAEADLAIGAAGSTAWERCCLGLPTIVSVLAENQREIAQALRDADAALTVGSIADDKWLERLVAAAGKLIDRRAVRRRMGLNAARVTRGDGAFLVSSELIGNTA